MATKMCRYLLGMNVIFPQSISCETESRGWPDCNELQRAWQSIRLWCDHDPAEAGLHGGHREAGRVRPSTNCERIFLDQQRLCLLKK